MRVVVIRVRFTTEPVKENVKMSKLLKGIDFLLTIKIDPSGHTKKTDWSLKRNTTKMRNGPISEVPFEGICEGHGHKGGTYDRTF